VAASLFAGSAAVAVHRIVFPFLSLDHDEPLYALQATMLRRLTTTLPGSQARFFRPWLAGPHGDRLISVFQPVWPAVLAVSSASMGSFIPAMAVMAAALVVACYLFVRELFDDRGLAAASAVVMGAAPYVWLRSGTMLAYTFSLFLELTFGTCVLRAHRGIRRRWWFAAGALLGVLAFTRPFDVLVLGVPLAIWQLVEHRRRWVEAARIGLVVALGALPGLALTLANNAHLTGHALRFPLHAAGGNNQFGFGWRQIAAGAPLVRITAVGSVRAAFVNLGRVSLWGFGSLAALPVAAFGAWRLRAHRRALAILATVAVAFPVANLFYWGNWLIARSADFLGPHYYLPLVVPLAVVTAAGIAGIAARWRWAAIGLTFVLAAASVVQVAPKLRDNLYFTRAAEHEWSRVHAAVGSGRAVVIIPTDADGGWIGHPRPSLLNDPQLHQRILYAIDRGPDSIQLATMFPDRSLYRLTPTIVPGRGPGGLEVSSRVDRQTVVAGHTIALRFTIENRTGAPVVRVYVTDGSSAVTAVLDERSRRGATYEGVWLLHPDGSVALTGQGRGVSGTIGALHGRATIAVGSSFAPSGGAPELLRQEQRLWFRNDLDSLVTLAPGARWVYFGPPRPRWAPFPTTGLQVEVSAGG
jgi:4-amino-4-deoxy-L-arabinose transferase-like glycosyltransferase